MSSYMSRMITHGSYDLLCNGYITCSSAKRLDDCFRTFLNCVAFLKTMLATSSKH